MHALGTDRSDEGGQTEVLAAIALGWFLTLGLRFVLPALLPQITSAFDIDNATAGLAVTVVWAGYGLMQFPAGVLVDYLDERRLLTLSLLLAGGSLGVLGGAPVFGVFLIAAGLFGFGTGLFGTTRGIALSNVFEPNPGRAFGVTLAAGSIGSAALPFLASLLTDEFGWRVAVGASAPLFLVTAVGTWLAVPAETTSESDGASDSGPALALGPFRRALADRGVVVAVAGLTLLLFTFQGLTAFLPTYLVEAKGLSPQTASALFAALFVAGAGFQLAGGRAVDRFGTRTVLVGVAFVGIFTLAALPALRGTLALALLVVVMASRLAVAPVSNAYVLSQLADESRGSVWGLFRTCLFLVSSTGSAVVGALSDRGLFDEAFYLLAGVTAVATVLFAFLPTRPDGESR